MAIWDLKTIICSSTITVRSSTDKKHNFMGILGPVYESNFPRSVFNVTSFDSKDCNVGHRFSNGSFNGMYKEIIDKNLDLGIFSSKHQLLYEEFTYSPVKGVDELIMYYYFYIKKKNTSILTSIGKINYKILVLLLTVIIITLILNLVRKKFLYKIHKTLFTVFISFFLANYILASLSVLLIELDKSVYLNNLQDLLVSKMYQPFFYTEDIEDYFKFSSKKLNKDIWKLYKKRNTKVYTVCNRANDFKLILRCMITMKRTKIVLIFEKRLLSMFGPAYCSNAHQYIERQDPYVIQYSKQLEEILTFIPFNKKMKREKKIFLDKYLGLTKKFNLESVKILKKQLITRNSECLESEKEEFFDSSYHFEPLTFENYESLFTILLFIQSVVLSFFFVVRFFLVKLFTSLVFIKKEF